MQLLDALAQIEIQEAKGDKKLEKCWLKANMGDSDQHIELQASKRCRKNELFLNKIDLIQLKIVLSSPS